jgi:hypothetical protein
LDTPAVKVLNVYLPSVSLTPSYITFPSGAVIYILKRIFDVSKTCEGKVHGGDVQVVVY